MGTPLDFLENAFCNDAEVLVLLIYWIWKAVLHPKCEVQMDCWNVEIININETCKKLGPKCF